MRSFKDPNNHAPEWTCFPPIGFVELKIKERKEERIKKMSIGIGSDGVEGIDRMEEREKDHNDRVNKILSIPAIKTQALLKIREISLDLGRIIDVIDFDENDVFQVQRELQKVVRKCKKFYQEIDKA